MKTDDVKDACEQAKHLVKDGIGKMKDVDWMAKGNETKEKAKELGQKSKDLAAALGRSSLEKGRAFWSDVRAAYVEHGVAGLVHEGKRLLLEVGNSGMRGRVLLGGGGALIAVVLIATILGGGNSSVGLERHTEKDVLLLGDKTLTRSERYVAEHVAEKAPSLYDDDEMTTTDLSLAAAYRNMSQQDKEAQKANMEKEYWSVPWTAVPDKANARLLKIFGLRLGMTRKQAESVLGKYQGRLFEFLGSQDLGNGKTSVYALKQRVECFTKVRIGFAYDEHGVKIIKDGSGYITGDKPYEGMCFARFRGLANVEAGHDKCLADLLALKKKCEKELGIELGEGNSRKDRYLAYFPKERVYVCVAFDGAFNSLTLCAEDLRQDMTAAADFAPPSANAVRTIAAFEEIHDNFYCGFRKNLFKADAVPATEGKNRYSVDRSKGRVSCRVVLSVNDAAYEAWKAHTLDLLSDVECAEDKASIHPLIAGKCIHLGEDECTQLFRWSKRNSLKTWTQPLEVLVECIDKKGKTLGNTYIDLKEFERSEFYPLPLCHWYRATFEYGRLKDMPHVTPETMKWAKIDKGMAFRADLVTDWGTDENGYSTASIAFNSVQDLDSVVDVRCTVVDYVDRIEARDAAELKWAEKRQKEYAEASREYRRKAEVKAERVRNYRKPLVKLTEDLVKVELNEVGGFCYFCKYEITQAQWAAIMGNNPSQTKGDDLPVDSVSCNECKAFVEKLNSSPEVSDKGIVFKLPETFELRYASEFSRFAGGDTSNYGYLHGKDGAQVDDVAWYAKNADGHSHPVGGKKPNMHGVYDYCGNVAEMCSDATALGGSWKDDEKDCQCSSSIRLNPDERLPTVGLRLMVDKKQEN